MSQPYIGEIRLVPYNFAPVGWNFCDGTVLPIANNDALFQLIGTYYGGDGVTTFALPDLRSRIPMHSGTTPGTGTNYTIAEQNGVEGAALSVSNLPAHTHTVKTATVADSTAPAGRYPGVSQAAAYGTKYPVNMAPTAFAGYGGRALHENRQPYLTLNFIISLFGIFPSQT